MHCCRALVGEKPFLEADLDISCSSPEYFAGAGLGLPSLLLYGAGIPLYYFIKMRTFHKAGAVAARRLRIPVLWLRRPALVVRTVELGAKGSLHRSDHPPDPHGTSHAGLGSTPAAGDSSSSFCERRPTAGWLNALERDALSVDALTLFLGLALFLSDTNSTDAKSEGLAMTLSLVIVP